MQIQNQNENNYPSNLKIEYTTTEGYRRNIRLLFSMSHNCKDVDVDNSWIDDETKDELDYDETASNLFVIFLYNLTCENVHFIKLYETSAALMLSTSLDIGMVVLLSYDYLIDFHLCICSFILDINGFTENNSHYKKLMERICNRK
jgi:hypothetical protein